SNAVMRLALHEERGWSCGTPTPHPRRKGLTAARRLPEVAEEPCEERVRSRVIVQATWTTCSRTPNALAYACATRTAACEVSEKSVATKTPRTTFSAHARLSSARPP